MRIGDFNPFRRNPEHIAQTIEKMGLKPFEILTNQVPEKIVLQFMADKNLMGDLASAKWPTDEASCEKIAAGHGLGAEQVAAISKYQRAITALKNEK